MWDLNTLQNLNTATHELALQGKQEKDSVHLMTDSRKVQEFKNLLENARLRNLDELNKEVVA